MEWKILTYPLARLFHYENDLYSSKEKLFFLSTFKMKGDLFYFKGLVNLKLGKHFRLHVCNSVWFPNLKKLHLQEITFDNARTSSYMVCNSPVLEQMVVEKCGMEAFFFVESDSLKSFTLICAPKAEHQFCNEFIEEYDIIISAKNLQYLRYEDHIRTISDKDHPDSLVEAYIDVYAMSEDVEDTISTIGKDLLLWISSAQFLHFSGHSLEVFSYTIGINCWPEYTNLTILGLAGNSFCGLLLPIFLKSSPNLQLLIYEDETLLDAKLNKFKWSPPDEVPGHGSLTAINIRGFDGQDDMVQLIRYFLQHGTLLNKISVSPKKLKPEELDLCKNSLRDFLKS